VVNVAGQKGVVLYEQGRFDLAAERLREALSVEPDDPHTHSLLALALLSIEPLSPKRLAEARFHSDTAVRLAPAWWLPHYALSVVWSQSLDWEPANEPNSPLGGARATPSQSATRATEAAREAVRLAPLSATCWSHLAYLRMVFERWGEALEAANSGLAIDPHDLQCLRFRALALSGLNRRKESDETLAQLLAAHPNDPVSHLELGHARLRQRAPRQEARSSFLEALRLDPTLRPAHTGLERTEVSVLELARRREEQLPVPLDWGVDREMAEERIPIGVRRWALAIAVTPLVIFFIEARCNFNGPFLRFLEWLL
jgi:tetratricopeptide (TPR) repeat protein